MPSDWRRTLFFALLAVGAIAATGVVIPTVGPHFFGLAIPIGMVGGLFLYMVVYSFSVYWDSETVSQPHSHSILLVGILAAIVAHFVEIHFGIAIAATRLYFWAYLGLLVLAQWPPFYWVYWLQLAGTTAMVLFSYCLLARVLSLMPWNRHEPFSLKFFVRTFFSAPVRGNILQGLPAE